MNSRGYALVKSPITSINDYSLTKLYYGYFSTCLWVRSIGLVSTLSNCVSTTTCWCDTCLMVTVQSQWPTSMENVLCHLHGYVYTINLSLLTLKLWSRHHFFKKCIYLFLALLGLRCSKRASHCGGAKALGSEGFSRWGSAALGRRLRSCGAWA